MKLDSIKFPKQKSVRGGWFLSYILVLIVPLLLCLLLYNYSAGLLRRSPSESMVRRWIRPASTWTAT